MDISEILASYKEKLKNFLLTDQKALGSRHIVAGNMAKFLILLAATAAVCSAAGPTQPDSRGRCDEELNKVVDQNNMCWYHECVNNDGYLEFLPRRCAGGSKISYNFVQGPENPCTVNFDSVIGYDCERQQPSVDGPPPCHDSSVRLQCQNGGVAVYEADKCWCDCPPSWQGDELCRLPTKPVTDLPAGSNICELSSHNYNSASFICSIQN
ncbi:hypothetical protein EB796_017467 [Bugula neritina]|uniref:EGF-like domain-containing protein n=1 Tax=Bugula neritina TaxID=10212 RepID=A0A7J7JDP5_BUGNE|nr:hypothetical protein EB796_017467 [Bugula neritina]